MSKSLAERLQQKLEDQTAEIAALTDSELKKLSTHVQSSVNAELSDIRNAIDKQLSGIRDDLPPLKWIVGLTWTALIISLMLTGFLLWRSQQSPPPQIEPKIEASQFKTVYQNQESYLVMPAGTESFLCKDGAGNETLCLKLPAED